MLYPISMRAYTHPGT